MKKILALDIGEKRIGVALSEDTVAATYGVVDNTNYQAAVMEIVKICNLEKIDQIVIGIPKSEDTFQADKIHTFAMELAKKIDVAVVYEDEAFTSKEAERVLSGSKLNPASGEYKQEVDKISAKLILEQYLGKNPK